MKTRSQVLGLETVAEFPSPCAIPTGCYFSLISTLLGLSDPLALIVELARPGT